MQIYTKTGDKGKTSLYGGICVDKNDLEIEAVGTLDEVNSWLGLLSSHNQDAKLSKILRREQNNIFTIGSYVAMIKDEKMRNKYVLSDKVAQMLEKEIDNWQKTLKPLKQFILPGGDALASEMFLVRTIIRRAERIFVELSEKYQINQEIIRYLNRLSDWMFVLARYQNNQKKILDIVWSV